MIYDNSISTIPVSFNGFDLNTSPSKVLGVDITNNAKVILNKYQLVHSDGEVVTNSNYGERSILVEGRIKGTSAANLDASLDTFKSYLIGINKNLDLFISGATRRFVASASEVSFTQKSACVVTWNIVFACNAFGKDTTATTLTMGTYTATNTGYTNIIAGSYKTNPVIDYTVNFVDNFWDAKYIDISNNAINERIRITRVNNIFDRIIIDGESKRVQLYPTTKTVIDLCEVLTGWTSTHTLTASTTNQKQGISCFSVNMAAAAAISSVSRLNYASMDLSSSMGFIIFPIFLPTPTAGTIASVRVYAGSAATLATDYNYYDKTTQFDGSALSINAWNYIKLDLSAAATGTNGTPVMTAIKSFQISVVGTSAAMQLSGWRLDYITVQKAGVIPQYIDFEGTFPSIGIGSSILTITDEYTTRNITFTGSYYKRYL